MESGSESDKSLLNGRQCGLVLVGEKRFERLEAEIRIGRELSRRPITVSVGSNRRIDEA